MLSKLAKSIARPGAAQPGQRLVDNLSFKCNERLQLGVEVELQVVDQRSLSLVPRADEIIAALPEHPNFVKELFKFVVEINSSVHDDAHGVADEFSALFSHAREKAKAIGCDIFSGGCHPVAHWGDLDVRDTGRYCTIMERNQWLMRRWMVCGMHIHLGMTSPQECIRYMNFFQHLLPHLLALSSSSPFWQENDTGLASCRPVMGEALPTASLGNNIASWDDFCNLVEKLEASGSITSLKDLWWDLRPSLSFGTMEIRVFDMPATLEEVKAITAFTHCLALWFGQHGEWLSQMAPPSFWMARENKWRAMRYGLRAEIISDESGTVKDIRDDIGQWLDRVADIARAQKYEAEMATLRQMLIHGSTSQRMQDVWNKTGSMEDVIRHNVREFEAGHPLPISLKEVGVNKAAV